MLEILSQQMRQLEAFRADVGSGSVPRPEKAAEPVAL